MSTMTYIPRARDIDWARKVLHLIKDGGILEYGGDPKGGCQYILDRKNKTLRMSNPEILVDPFHKRMHERGILVFKQIGWQVVVEEGKWN